MQLIEIWIEAEVWPSDTWTPRDTNTDVIVTLADRSRWGATLFTYQNTSALTQRYHTTGDCLAGDYFWVPNMILIDEVRRPLVEAIINDLLAKDQFTSAFRRLEESTTDKDEEEQDG